MFIPLTFWISIFITKKIQQANLGERKKMSKNKELLVFESRKLGSPVIPVFSVLFDGAVVLGAATLVKKKFCLVGRLASAVVKFFKFSLLILSKCGS